MAALRKFSSQAEPELLEAMQQIAAREGRKFQAVLGEAMREYLARRGGQARRNVLGAFDQSLRERDELYRALSR